MPRPARPTKTKKSASSRARAQERETAPPPPPPIEYAGIRHVADGPPSDQAADPLDVFNALSAVEDAELGESNPLFSIFGDMLARFIARPKIEALPPLRTEAGAELRSFTTTHAELIGRFEMLGGFNAFGNLLMRAIGHTEPLLPNLGTFGNEMLEAFEEGEVSAIAFQVGDRRIQLLIKS